jgi:hypothetical protein
LARSPYMVGLGGYPAEPSVRAPQECISGIFPKVLLEEAGENYPFDEKSVSSSGTLRVKHGVRCW